MIDYFDKIISLIDDIGLKTNMEFTDIISKAVSTSSIQNNKVKHINDLDDKMLYDALVTFNEKV